MTALLRVQCARPWSSGRGHCLDRRLLLPLHRCMSGVGCLQTSAGFETSFLKELGVMKDRAHGLTPRDGSIKHVDHEEVLVYSVRVVG